MGDRIGRKKVLFITIALMGASTTLIGVLPTYAMIGISAPILLVALRLVQGFGAGAEIAGATVMLAEYAPVKRRGLIASLVSLGTNSGTLAASALWAFLLGVLSEEQLLSWGWRLPFLLSFVLMVFALWLRLNLKESPVFEERPDVVDGVALSRARGRGDRPPRRTQSVLEAGLKQRKGKAFFLALGPAVRPGRQLRARADLPRRLHRHARCWSSKSVADRGDRVRLAARLRHHPDRRPARRPLRPPPGLHRADRADHRVRLPDAAADHQRQQRRHWCWPWSSA